MIICLDCKGRFTDGVCPCGRRAPIVCCLPDPDRRPALREVYGDAAFFDWAPVGLPETGPGILFDVTLTMRCCRSHQRGWIATYAQCEDDGRRFRCEEACINIPAEVGTNIYWKWPV